jgi:hypothetical protein
MKEYNMTTTTITEPTFEEILVSALTSDINSHELYDLVDQTQLAIVTATNDAHIAKAIALDPIQSPDANAARATMEAAQFRAARLQSLLPRLKSRATEIGNQEEYSRWRARFDPLALKVADAAARLKEFYTKFAPDLAVLLSEIEKIDAEVLQVASAKPHYAKAANGDNCRLHSVELMARGLTDFRIGSRKIMDIELPDWQRPTELLWPPNRTIDWSGMMTPSKPHPGDRWWEVREQEHAEKAADAERLNAEFQSGEAERRAAVHRPRGIISH